MINIDVRSDIRGMQLRLSKLDRDMQEKAVVRALNKTADQAKVASSRVIREAGYNMKVADIKKQVTVLKASRGKLVALVRVSGRPIPLIKFGARQTRKGVTVKVKDGRKLISGAFIATMPNGHVGVFKNLHSSKHKKLDKKRFVIQADKRMSKGFMRSQGKLQELFGPSIPKAFGNKIVQENMIKFVRDKFPVIFKQEAKYILSRK